MRRFTLTTQHIALLRGLAVTWDSSPGAGCPMFSPRNPYRGAHGSALDAAIHHAGLPPARSVRVYDEEGRFSHIAPEYPEGVPELARQLHRELELALAIVLQIGEFQPGTYVDDCVGWQLERHARADKS